jgi:hypothetical protein
MFLNVQRARRVAAGFVLASILSVPVTSYGYDLPKQPHQLIPVPVQKEPVEPQPQPLPNPPAPLIPLEDQIPGLLPGNTVFPNEYCGIEYTICKFGKESWDYTREMQLREEIALAEFWVDAASNEPVPNEQWIDLLIEKLNALIEELQNLIEGRPEPQEGDPCLIKYRQCLLEEYKNRPKEEGAG